MVDGYIPIEFTTTQMKVLAYTYYVSPPISLLGSSLLVHAVIKGQRIRKRLKPSFVRLVTGFAVMDIVQSVGSLAFGPWSVPADTSYVWNASGNIATCNANGFFTNFLVGFCLYSACLALYHLMTVRYGWQEEFIAKRIEPVFHCFTWGWNIVSGILLIALGFMNPVPSNPGYCWAHDLPASCSWDYENIGLVCERGEGYWAFALVLGTAAIVLSILTIAIAFLIIYRKVRETERQIAQYTSSYLGDSSSATQMKLTQKTGRHAMRYIGAFLICNLPILAAQAGPEYHFDQAAQFYFHLGYLANLIVPLQGFLNACIFFHSNPSFFREGAPLHWVCDSSLLRCMCSKKPDDKNHDTHIVLPSNDTTTTKEPPSTQLTNDTSGEKNCSTPPEETLSERIESMQDQQAHGPEQA